MHREISSGGEKNSDSSTVWKPTKNSVHNMFERKKKQKKKNFNSCDRMEI